MTMGYDEHFNELSILLQAAVDSAETGIIAIDTERVIRFANPKALKLLSLEKSVIGKNVKKVIPQSRMVSVLETKTEQKNIKVRYDQYEFNANIYPIYHDNKIAGAVSYFNDVTELVEKSSELKKLKDYHNTLEAILDHAYEGICVVDRNGYITMINKTYVDFLGTSSEEAIGAHCTKVIPNTRLHIAAKTGMPEIGHVQEIGNKKVIVMRIPIKENGVVTGVVGKVMFKDIKEAKALVGRLTVLENQLNYYKEELKKERGAKYSLKNIITKNEQVKEMKRLIVQAAKSTSTVLVQGESGTGKELVAHAIHELSDRRYRPFIKINCAAIPDNLLESELFGYEKGAFTGAKQEGKIGKFELANKGTIFLDEIGDMSLNMQGKLLRVLQEREVERVGGTKTYPLDIRVIAATNSNLQHKMKNGEFREDLFYRIKVVTVTMPPLRERVEDIPLIVKALIDHYNSEFSVYVKDVDESVNEILMSYSWSGNIRELKNVIERAFNVLDEDIIRVHHLPDYIHHAHHQKEGVFKSINDLNEIINQAEKDAILRALNLTKGNKRKAAQLLGIHRSGLYQKMNKHQLPV